MRISIKNSGLRWMLAACVFFLLIWVVVVLVGNTQSTQHTMRVGVYKGEAALLPFIAEKENFFSQYGLDIELIPYSSGRDACVAMLRGDVDYATCSELVLVRQHLRQQKYRIVTVISEGDINGFLAHRASGIDLPKDVEGKKIGTFAGTAAEYLLGVWLEAHGLSMDAVEMVGLTPENIEEKYLARAVDGIFVWEPYLYRLVRQTGHGSIRFPLPQGYPYYFLLVGNEEKVQKGRKAKEALLAALEDAQGWVATHPQRTADFITETFNYDHEYTQFTLGRHQFGTGLPKVVAVAMRKEAQWIMSNRGGAQATQSFDYETLMDAESLNYFGRYH